MIMHELSRHNLLLVRHVDICSAASFITYNEMSMCPISCRLCFLFSHGGSFHHYYGLIARRKYELWNNVYLKKKYLNIFPIMSYFFKIKVNQKKQPFTLQLQLGFWLCHFMLSEICHVWCIDDVLMSYKWRENELANHVYVYQK